MTRSLCCSEEKEQWLKKGPWTPDEDQKLVAYIQQHGHGSWRSLPINAGLQRCGKSCRLRWTNYLRPDIKRGRFSQEEDRMIVHLHEILGNRWSAIASHLPRRTDNEIKNYWNTHLKKRLVQMSIDPVTHMSTAAADDLELDNILPSLQRPVVSSTASHMSQWDCARAEAEARLKSSLTSSASDFRAQTSCPGPQQTAFNTSANPAKATSTVQGASTVFMRSWKSQVAETLRPSFGVVEMDRPAVANPINLQTFLHDWETSFQAPQPQTLRSMSGPFAAYDSPIDVPDFSSGTASPQNSCLSHVLSSPARTTERLLASRGRSGDSLQYLPPAGKTSMFAPPQIGSRWESSQFNSPTSTLHGPEYDSSYSNSSCVSSSGGDSFEVLAQSLNSLIQQQHEQTRSGLVFAAEPSFWLRQPSEPYVILPELSTSKRSFGLSQVTVPNRIPTPQFDFLCWEHVVLHD